MAIQHKKHKGQTASFLREQRRKHHLGEFKHKKKEAPRRRKKPSFVRHLFKIKEPKHKAHRRPAFASFRSIIKKIDLPDAVALAVTGGLAFSTLRGVIKSTENLFNVGSSTQINPPQPALSYVVNPLINAKENSDTSISITGSGFTDNGPVIILIQSGNLNLSGGQRIYADANGNVSFSTPALYPASTMSFFISAKDESTAQTTTTTLTLYAKIMTSGGQQTAIQPVNVLPHQFSPAASITDSGGKLYLNVVGFPSNVRLTFNVFYGNVEIVHQALSGFGYSPTTTDANGNMQIVLNADSPAPSLIGAGVISSPQLYTATIFYDYGMADQIIAYS